MARILRQTTVVRDGYHNAFTDLQYWQGQYWVSYRKGTAHVSMDGTACVSVSVDRQRFQQAANVKVSGDVRDPKLVPIDDRRIAMGFASWIGGVKASHLQQFMTFSTDGFNWETPRPILQPNRFLWRIRKHGERYYGMAYSRRQTSPQDPKEYALHLSESTDLIEWRDISQIGTGDLLLNEADLNFRPDGEVWVVARSERRPSFNVFASAKPPYRQWDVTELHTMIHAPAILEHAGALYVAGRRNPTPDNEPCFPFLSRHSLGVWRLERGRVEPVMHIPATGDCSYPGFIHDPDGRICMSYYSQHAYDMGVVDRAYIRQTREPWDTGSILSANDIYFAEIELP